jgi:hypothetical protein
VTGLAFGYALVVSIIARGKRQAAAIGFAVTSALYVLALTLAPESASSHRAYEAVVPMLHKNTYFYDGDLYERSTTNIPKSRTNYKPAISAANAVAVMVAGLVGCCLGALAFRQDGS